MWQDLLIRARALIRHRAVERELDEELRFHLERQTAAHVRAGLSPEDAARRARVEFGGLEQVKEGCRDARGTRWIEDAGGDLRNAFRMLLKDRWFAAAAITALAACIGASTAVFAVVNALSRGLPVDGPDRIVRIAAVDHEGRPLRWTSRDFDALRGATGAVEGIAAFRTTEVHLRDERQAAEPVAAAFVSANAFRLLGEPPMLGRDFRPDEDRPGAPSVVILGARVWRSRYGSDPAVIGRTVHVNDASATVIGVMRDGFRFPMVTDFWQTLGAMPDRAETPEARVLDAFARLRASGTAPAAQSELQRVASNLAKARGEKEDAVQVRVTPYADSSPAHHFFAALLGAVGFVLLVGCANVATLQLARAAHRAHETGIRLVQGATRARILRQVLVENAVLALLAGVLGFALSVAALDLLVRNLEGINFPYWLRWTMDGRVYVFTALVVVACAGLCAIAPAFQIFRLDVVEALRERGRAASAGVRVHRWTNAVLAAELALTVVLLTGAGLMMRSFLALHRADLVVDAPGVLITRLRLPAPGYERPEQWSAYFRRLEARLEAAPLVESFALASGVPFIGAPRRTLSIEGRPDAPGSSASWVPAGPRYFETLGVPLVRGRPFSPDGGHAELETAVVNQRFAKLYFDGADPIGRRLRLAPPDAAAAAQPQWFTIVGMSPDVRHQQAVDLNDVDPVVHVPHDAMPDARTWLLVRGSAARDVMARAIRQELSAVDGAVPVGEIISLEQYMTQSQWGHRVFAAMFSTFAWIALTLSAIGLYAVTAYAATRRTREIGIRVAVGARSVDVIWLLAHRQLVPLAAGLGLGLAGAVAVGRLLKSFLLQTSATEPATIALTSGVLAAVALAACVVPARRAAGLDPVTALRCE